MWVLSTIAQPIASQRQREDWRARYNLDLFEGDIKISSKEIETYYEDNEQSTNVSNSPLVVGKSRQCFYK